MIPKSCMTLVYYYSTTSSRCTVPRAMQDSGIRPVVVSSKVKLGIWPDFVIQHLHPSLLQARPAKDYIGSMWELHFACRKQLMHVHAKKYAHAHGHVYMRTMLYAFMYDCICLYKRGVGTDVLICTCHVCSSGEMLTNYLRSLAQLRNSTLDSDTCQAPHTVAGLTHMTSEATIVASQYSLHILWRRCAGASGIMRCLTFKC